jgi:uncharacterized protein (TIGR03032 family)
VKPPRNGVLADMWARHSADWRSTAQIASHWREAAGIDPRLLEVRVRGPWWDLLDRLGATLFVTREYEHLVMAFSARGGKKRVSYLALPHPSGLVVDRARGQMHVASTRNPNQIFSFRPVAALDRRDDLPAGAKLDGRPMLASHTTFFPGSLYMHDLAMIGGRLHANAVGQNAVVALTGEGQYRRVWWPRSIERKPGVPDFGRNYIQLNSIAAGASVQSSFFSASVAAPGRRRPGHLDFPVDGRGVIFSGRTREPICAGLTRPHSARLHRGRVWVDNSGYGQVGYAEGGRLEVVARLPGWTRGLCFAGDVAFAGTSRVIPKYARYAPGVKPDDAVCGVHAFDTKTGRTLASVEWPFGNQIFAIDWIDSAASGGFLFIPFRIAAERAKTVFYAYDPQPSQKESRS